MALLTDGFSTTISFAADADIKLYEKSVTVPGVDLGGAIDITTMLNTNWRTFAAKSLATLTEASFTVSYDTVAYAEVIALVGMIDIITITWPDTATLAFMGYLNTFSPGGAEEGEQPEADCTIVVTNANQAGVETAPTHTPA